MYLGNIISEERIDNVEDFISLKREINFEDVKIPTLIVGWKLVKKLFPTHNISILDKKIDNNLFWTFSKSEKKIDYENDINTFYDYIINNINTNLTYYYFDTIKSSITKVKKLLNILNSDRKKFIYVYNNSFIYIYYSKFVIGVSLDELDFIGIDSSKVIKKLYNYRNVSIFYETSFLSFIMKRLIYNNTKLIPFLYANLVN